MLVDEVVSERWDYDDDVVVTKVDDEDCPEFVMFEDEDEVTKAGKNK
jgi:hypothetical protein